MYSQLSLTQVNTDVFVTDPKGILSHGLGVSLKTALITLQLLPGNEELGDGVRT